MWAVFPPANRYLFSGAKAESSVSNSSNGYRYRSPVCALATHVIGFGDRCHLLRLGNSFWHQSARMFSGSIGSRRDTFDASRDYYAGTSSANSGGTSRRNSLGGFYRSLFSRYWFRHAFSHPNHRHARGAFLFFALCWAGVLVGRHRNVFSRWYPLRIPLLDGDGNDQDVSI